MSAHDLFHFVLDHPMQLTITLVLVIYSVLRSKLTADGIAAAVCTAIIHILHPSRVPFLLLCTFFALGTLGTRVKHAQKQHLTKSESSDAGGAEGARSAGQVCANSGMASLLIVLDLQSRSHGKDAHMALIGVVAVYAAATADTLSSELGILSSTPPFLITSPMTSVPKGTNGGVTTTGLLAGLAGSSAIALAAYASVPGLSMTTAVCLAMFGLAGSILDSLLGAILQSTVEDKTSGLVIEGKNGAVVKSDSNERQTSLQDGFPSVPMLLAVTCVAILYQGASTVMSPFAALQVMAKTLLPCVVIGSIVNYARIYMTTETDSEHAISGHSKIASVTTHKMPRFVRGNNLLNNNGVNFVMTVAIAVSAMQLYGIGALGQ